MTERLTSVVAEGKVYIGVGAWGNSKGDPGDNKQVRIPHSSNGGFRY